MLHFPGKLDVRRPDLGLLYSDMLPRLAGQATGVVVTLRVLGEKQRETRIDCAAGAKALAVEIEIQSKDLEAVLASAAHETSAAQVRISSADRATALRAFAAALEGATNPRLTEGAVRELGTVSAPRSGSDRDYVVAKSGRRVKGRRVAAADATAAIGAPPSSKLKSQIGAATAPTDLASIGLLNLATWLRRAAARGDAPTPK